MKLKIIYARAVLVIIFIPLIAEYIIRELCRAYRNMWMKYAIKRGVRRWIQLWRLNNGT